jgi:ribonuclease P protein component
MVYADLKPEHNCFPGIPAILFAVSKKTVPSAVGRNRIKRMMKEAYRIEKSLIPWIGKNPHDDGQDEVLCIAFLYSGSRKTFPDLEAFREEIRRLMQSIKLS